MTEHEDDQDNGLDSGNGHEPEHEHDVDEALEEALELDTQSQIFLEMRRQNLDLLKIASEVAGFSGTHAPLKQNEVKNTLKMIWDIYSELYAWVDPEESEDDDDEDDDL
jgi:hypothetical protein